MAQDRGPCGAREERTIDGGKGGTRKVQGLLPSTDTSGRVRLQNPIDKDDGLAPILTAPTVCQVRGRHFTGCSLNSSLNPKSRDHAHLHFTDEETDFVRMVQVQVTNMQSESR